VAFVTLLSGALVAMYSEPGVGRRIAAVCGLVGASGMPALALHGLPPFETPAKAMMATGVAWYPIEVIHGTHWIGVVLSLLAVAFAVVAAERARGNPRATAGGPSRLVQLTMLMMVGASLTVPYFAPLARHAFGMQKHWRFHCVTKEGASVVGIAPNLSGINLDSMWLQDASDPRRVWNLQAGRCTYESSRPSTPRLIGEWSGGTRQ
jgi:hypothetical protein